MADPTSFMTFLTVRQPPNPTAVFPSPCDHKMLVVLQVHDGQNLTLSGVTMRSDRLPTLDASITVMGGGSIIINSTYVSGGVNRVSISSNKLDVLLVLLRPTKREATTNFCFLISSSWLLCVRKGLG